jgi:hypothetical protein
MRTKPLIVVLALVNFVCGTTTVLGTPSYWQSALFALGFIGFLFTVIYVLWMIQVLAFLTFANCRLEES